LPLSQRLFAFGGLLLVCFLWLPGPGGVTRSEDKPPLAAKPADTVWEHRGSVFSVAFSPDGKTLLTGGPSATNEAHLWDVATGRRLQSFQTRGVVRSVAFAPDGKRVALGSSWEEDGEGKSRVSLWDVTTAKEVVVLKGSLQGGSILALSPDGKILATAGREEKGKDSLPVIQLWDPATGKERQILRGHKSYINFLTFSPDGKTLAAASGGFGWGANEVVLWDVSSGKQRLSLPRALPVRSLAFSPDGKTLASTGYNDVNEHTQLLLWDTATGKRLASLPEHNVGLLALAFSPDGKTLATGEGGGIRLWDLAARKSRAVLKADALLGGFVTIAFSPDGKTLAAGCGVLSTASPSRWWGQVALWDMTMQQQRLSPAESAALERATTERRQQQAEQERAREERVRRRQDAERQLTDGERARLREARVLARRHRHALHLLLAQKALEAGNEAAALALLERERPGPGEEDLRGFEWYHLRRLCQDSTTWLQHEDRVEAAWLAPDGNTLAVRQAQVVLWDLPTAKRRVTLDAFPAERRHLVFSPDGKVVATISGERKDARQKEVDLWEAATGKLLATLKEHTDVITCLAFSPDGKTVATGSKDKSIRVWEVATGKAAGLMAQEEEVSALAFSPDGKVLASAGDGGGLCLWQPSSGKRLAEAREADKGSHKGLVFDPGGKFLFSVTDTHVAKQWLLPPGKGFAVARRWEDVEGVIPSPDGETLALVGSGEVVLWDRWGYTKRAVLPSDRESDKEVGRISPPGSLVAFSPDGKQVLLSRDGSARLVLYDADTGAEIGRRQDKYAQDTVGLQFGPGGRVLWVAGPSPGGRQRDTVRVVQAVLGPEATHPWDHSGEFHSLAFAPQGKLLAAAQGDSVSLRDLVTRKERAIKGLRGEVAFSADGRTLLAYGSSGVALWDVTADRERASFKDADDTTVSADGKRVCWLGPRGAVMVHDAATGEELATLKGKGPEAPALPPGWLSWWFPKLIVSPAAKWLIRQTDQREMILWDVAARQELARWDRSVRLDKAVFSPDEKTLVLADRDGTVTMRELPSLKLRAVLEKSWREEACAVSPDGKLAALAASDTTVKLVDLATGEERAQLQGYDRNFDRIAFSPDGRTVVTSDWDGMIQFWDPVTGEERLSLRHQTGVLRSLAFSPDGTTLATSSGKRVQLWSAPRDDPGQAPPRSP
jgi:WD40 repeat protein